MAKAKRDKKAINNEPDAIFASINGKIQDSISDSTQWATKQNTWHKLRMRIKKEKTFPFVGSSNIRIPTAETKIRKIKAALHNSIFGIRPVVQVIPSPSGSMDVARKIEKFLDHLIVDKMKLNMKSVIALDQSLEKGFELFKPYWKYETMNRIEEFGLEDMSQEEAIAFFSPETPVEMLVTHLVEKLEVDTHERVVEENQKAVEKAIAELKSGKESVKITLVDVLCDYPDVALCSPERVYVPSDSGYDPQECSFLVHEFFLPLRTLKMNVYGKGWDESAVNEISSKKGIDTQKLTDITKDQREGISRLNNPSELVKVWEFYGWEDINGDGEEEKCLVTLAPEFAKTLRKITLPYDNGLFPFVKLFWELTDDRWFAHRGIVEIIEDLIKEIDIQHMQKLDNQTIRNAPMFVYRAGMVNPNLVQFIPNQGIPVHGMNPLSDTLNILNNSNSNVEFSYEKEEQILEGKVQELIGQVDFTLQSQINRRQPRTLGEVELQSQNQQMVFSLDASLCKDAFEKVFNWVWDLWSQFGQDVYEFAYFGKEGWEKIRMTREETQGKWTITVRGNDQNTNPQVRLQKANMIMQMSSNPVALQTGVVTPIHLAEAYKRAYQELDVPNWEMLFDQQPKPQQAPQEPLIVPKFADLEEGEQAQILPQFGIQPDIASMQLKKQQELSELQHEQQYGEKELQLKEAELYARSQERESKRQETAANRKNS